MKRRALLLTAATVLLAAGTASAQVQKPEEPLIPAESDFRIPEPPPTGDLVLIDDHWWTTLLSDEPQRMLKEAMERLKEGDPKTAALDIRKAAAHTRVAAARSDAELKGDLLGSVRELDVLAKRLENAEIISPDSLSLPFARDLQALAAHHAEKAIQHWAKGSAIRAGYDLKAAAFDLEAAAAWARSEELSQVANLAASAEAESDRLIEEQSRPSDLVPPLLTQVQQTIAALRGTVGRGPAAGR